MTMKLQMKKKSTTTPVYAKSEFWTSIATAVSGLLLAFGVFTPSQASTVTALVQQIIGGLLTLVSSSKFVSTQHSAKIEVFRALCATHFSPDGKVKAQGVKAQGMSMGEDQIASIARIAGL